MKRQTRESGGSISLTARHSITTNPPCIAEKSLIAVESVASVWCSKCKPSRAAAKPLPIPTTCAACLPEGRATKKLVGKSHRPCWKAAGIAVPAKAPRLLIALVNADDPRVTSEQLMPMLPVVKVSDFDSALALALKVEEAASHRYHALAERVAPEPRGPHPANP